MSSIRRNSKQQLQAPPTALRSTRTPSLVAPAYYPSIAQLNEIYELERHMMVSVKSSLSMPVGPRPAFVIGALNNTNINAIPDNKELEGRVDVPRLTGYPLQTKVVDTTTCQVGSWVAFSIDIMELARREPSNSFLQANLGYYPVGKYVGYVTRSFARSDAKGRHVDYITVLLLAPAQHRIEDVVARMSVPIDAGICGGEHGRPSLTTNLPFPWPGCRQLTNAGLHLEVTQAHNGGLTVCSTGESHRRFRVSCQNDFDWVTGDRSSCDVWKKWKKAKEYTMPVEIWRDIIIAGPVGHQPPDPTLLLTEMKDIREMLSTHV
ncbi:hypothetical protein BD410DRAFT_901292 [Rickenella mellea]|uniref:Uncharacterized protein n=1 Tax=Rickenella mellea TaxID=50990 RepID=A0A4Y7PRF1_9AGAM|nr:hypothetical protein BD410DRAFT_901292 [Rickenella mellea]